MPRHQGIQTSPELFLLEQQRHLRVRQLERRWDFLAE
jgi:hypothetical protein